MRGGTCKQALERARDAARRGGTRAICSKPAKQLSHRGSKGAGGVARGGGGGVGGGGGGVQGGFDLTHDAAVLVLAWQLQLELCRSHQPIRTSLLYDFIIICPCFLAD